MDLKRNKIVIFHKTINLEKLAKESGIPLEELKTKINKENLDYKEILKIIKNYNIRAIDISRQDIVEQLENFQKTEKKIPIIGIMGHVDHGKTTLVESLLQQTLTKKEAGGITQHISSYKINTKFGEVLMIDTPGHQVFTHTRRLILSVVDLLILIVSVEDGVKDQTKEIIQAAKNIPKIICINKIDAGLKNIDRIYGELASLDLLSEEYGGEILTNLISGKTGEGVDKLLENIQLQADTQDLKTNYNIEAQGIIVDSVLKQGMGVICKVILTAGNLQIGDNVVINEDYFKIKKIICNGIETSQAVVGNSIEILGANQQPIIGSKFLVINHVDLVKPLQAILTEEKEESLAENKESGFNFILKVDRAAKISILKKEVAKFGKIVLTSVGEINDTDVRLARGDRAIIVAWLSPNKASIKLLEENNVQYIHSEIIYKLMDDLETLITPKAEDEYVDCGVGDITHIFNMKKSKIAGCKVSSGIIKIGQTCEIRRKDMVVTRSKIVSMKREKFNIEEARSGSECGIILDAQNTQFEIGDQLVAIEKKDKENKK